MGAGGGNGCRFHNHITGFAEKCGEVCVGSCGKLFSEGIRFLLCSIIYSRNFEIVLPFCDNPAYITASKKPDMNHTIQFTNGRY